MVNNRIKSAVILFGLLAVLLVVSLRHRDRPAELVHHPPEAAEINERTVTPPPAPTHAGIVSKNASFFDLMAACGITPREIRKVERNCRDVYDFRRIYPGQRYELFADTSGHIETLTFSIDDECFVEVSHDGEKIRAERKTYPSEIETRSASGMITSSLFTSLQEQEINHEVGLRLVDIFAWDIDFFTDLRKNDYYRVIYEERTRLDTGTRRIGNIIAAEFNTQGTSHYAFLFENEANFPDYFDENGKSLRKQLLRAPLSYTRISSGFSHRRYHPILHHYRPHHGIDYAAPAGTAVMTTGDGTVIKAEYRKGNGRYIKIKHNQNMITYYLHLSRFAKGIKYGAKVKQGQVIGYVGSTGYSTGPHLDYRVKKNGRFVNPRKIKLPPANPVTDENMPTFALLRDNRIASLTGIPIKDWRTKTYADRDRPQGGAGEASPPHGAASR